MTTRADVERELVRREGLYRFASLAWEHVEPSPFVANWHLEEVCKHLEAVSKGEIKNLLINVPPGTGKSLFVSVFWPCWEWIERPKTKWFYASFDAGLVGRDSEKMINLLSSDWFMERWGTMLPRKSNAKMFFENGSGGFRFNTSVGGKGTGRHGDIQVVDDPIKPLDVMGGSAITKKAIRKVSDWWGGTMSSRRADPETFRRVIIMQRLHEEDLAGEMLSTGKYVHLRLPMLFDSSSPCKTVLGGDKRTQEGELLFPNRYPETAVTDIKETSIPGVFDTQYQQNPSRKGGSVFLRDWWRFWHTRENVPDPFDPTRMCAVLPTKGLDIQSWDCAFKGKDSSDFVAGGLWRTVGRDHFLCHSVNERMSFTRTISAILGMSARYPTAYDKLIEDAANGPAVEDSLKCEIHGVTLVKPQGGKEARAHACTPAFAGGRVYIPHPDLAPWVLGKVQAEKVRLNLSKPDITSYIGQLEAFPNTVNDDMVDMTSQALVRLRQFGNTFSEAMAKLRGEKK